MTHAVGGAHTARGHPRAALAGKAAISWSGGKDACLAGLLAAGSGLRIASYLTMCEPDGTSKSHALPPALLAAQAASLGGHWLPVNVEPAAYARTFDDRLAQLAAGGHTHLVFGDIDLQAHRDWLEPRCNEAGLIAVFPLWRRPRERIAREIVALGIEAIVVCVDTRWLDARFCGVRYDESFLDSLPDGVCPCGESGEFHTFVVDAPGFGAPIPVVDQGQRTVPSKPPLSPTTLVYQRLALASPATG